LALLVHPDEQRSALKTAKAANMTQPGASKLLADCKASLGVQLFNVMVEGSKLLVRGDHDDGRAFRARGSAAAYPSEPWVENSDWLESLFNERLAIQQWVHARCDETWYRRHVERAGTNLYPRALGSRHATLARHAVTFGMSTLFDAAISFKLGAPCASSTAGGNA
jgi:hypothetical protein